MKEDILEVIESGKEFDDNVCEWFKLEIKPSKCSCLCTHITRVSNQCIPKQCPLNWFNLQEESETK